MKFSRKDFREKFLGEKLFREAFIEILRPHLELLLGSKELSPEDKLRYGDFMREQEEITLQNDIIGEDLLVEEKRKATKKVKVA